MSDQTQEAVRRVLYEIARERANEQQRCHARRQQARNLCDMSPEEFERGMDSLNRTCKKLGIKGLKA